MKALMLDLDGVLYQGSEAIPGTREAIAWLNQHKVPHLFVTNTSSRPRRAICKKLADMGIEVQEDKILTPPIATRQWIKTHKPGPSVLLVQPDTLIDFEGITQLPDNTESGAANIVIGDLGERWDYSLLNRAFRLLMTEPRPNLIALGMTRYWRAEDGLRLDVAPFVKALEYASGCEALVLGKPSSDFFHQALTLLEAQADDVLMIGDDIVGDVQGAQLAGLSGALVKTGKFQTTDLEGSISPDAILDSIADLPHYWKTLTDTS